MKKINPALPLHEGYLSFIIDSVTQGSIYEQMTLICFKSILIKLDVELNMTFYVFYWCCYVK